MMSTNNYSVDESNRGDDDDFNDHEFTALTHDSNTSLTQDVNISLTQDDNPIASSAADATFNMISKPFQVYTECLRVNIYIKFMASFLNKLYRLFK